jgi:hypothetical protein
MPRSLSTQRRPSISLEGRGVEREAARFDAREVEEAVDDTGQLVGGAVPVVHIVPRAPGQSRAEREVGVADDGVDGGADLVADVGEEGGLGAASRLRVVSGGPKRGLQLFPPGDVVGDGAEAVGLAVRSEQRELVGLEHDLRHTSGR